MSPEGIYTAKIVNGAVPDSNSAYQFLFPHLMEDVFYDAYPTSVLNRVDLSSAREYTRELIPWLDIDQYIQQFMRLSDEELWKSVVKTADPNIVTDLARVWNVPPVKVASKISLHNARFYGFLPAFSLTAIYGMEITNILRPYVLKSTLAPALAEAATFFETPVTSMDDLRGRVTVLFPPEHADQEPHSAYSLLEENHAFSTDEMECPVKKPTLYFLEAFGRAFEGKYGDTFVERVWSREIKQRKLEEEKERRLWEQRRQKN